MAGHRLIVALVAATATLGGVAASVATAPLAAAATNYGFQDQSTAGAGTSDPTADKPESKLWYAAGYWWADLWDTTTSSHRIFRLDRTTQTWVSTGTEIDARSATQSDTLWDGSHLYVASHVIAGSSTKAVNNRPAQLYRYSLSGTTWSLDPGFPVVIETYSVESLTIALDSQKRLFAAWTRGAKVYLTQTTGPADGGSVSFMTPFIPAVSGTSVSSDDIATVVAYGGGHVMAMWSNQSLGQFDYAVHADGASATAWTGGVAASGTLAVDDHVNLKASPQGDVYAAVKTSRNDASPSTPTDPLIELLVYTGSSGTWHTYTYSTVADSETRPVVQLDPQAGVVHMYATGPSQPNHVAYEGTIYEKTASMSNPSFPSGLGTPVIRDASSAHMNNPTGTKQTVSSASGIVILADNASTLRYWHSDEGGSAPPPPPPAGPVASFTANPTSGTAPLTVQFTDTSTGSPTSWSWNFGDGATSTAQNPSHTYSGAGSYSVTLTVSNANGSNTSPATAISVSTSAPPPTGNVLFRVNAGGDAIAASPTWTADTKSAPSTYTNQSAAYSTTSSTSATITMTNPSVPAGTPMALFQTQRYDVSKAADMQWTFPVASGTYTVRLYFAETYSGCWKVGCRVFDVYANGGLVLDHEDVYADAGKNTGVVKSFTVQASGGQINLDFKPIAQNPLVQGIEILSAG
jgi:PKD repeat protein